MNTFLSVYFDTGTQLLHMYRMTFVLCRLKQLKHRRIRMWRTTPSSWIYRDVALTQLQQLRQTFMARKPCHYMYLQVNFGVRLMGLLSVTITQLWTHPPGIRASPVTESRSLAEGGYIYIRFYHHQKVNIFRTLRTDERENDFLTVSTIACMHTQH